MANAPFCGSRGGGSCAPRCDPQQPAGSSALRGPYGLLVTCVMGVEAAPVVRRIRGSPDQVTRFGGNGGGLVGVSRQFGVCYPRDSSFLRAVLR